MRRIRVSVAARRPAVRHRLPILVLAATTAWLVGLAPRSAAADPVKGFAGPSQRQGQGGPGFAFGAPRGYFVIKAGWLAPRADSDIYAFNSEQLTLDLDSYNTPLFGIDVGAVVNDRVDFVFGFEVSRSSPVSEFRDYTDEFGAPISQRTRLTQVPLTVGVRINLIERGRGVGSYAWVPNTAVPYVGAGAGLTWWRYEQFGDFVDFADLSIFTDHFLTEGWAPGVHVMGGVDVSVSPHFMLNFEGRYGWASGELAPAFAGFEPIDLAGFRVTAGAAFLF